MTSQSLVFGRIYNNSTEYERGTLGARGTVRHERAACADLFMGPCCAGVARGGAVPLFAILARELRATNALTAKAPEITTADNITVGVVGFKDSYQHNLKSTANRRSPL